MMIILITLFICTGTVLGQEARIKNADDFISFVSNVNSGNSNYAGTTVYLDSDLFLSNNSFLVPIGKDMYHYFRSVFDGQGHVISGLKINSSSLEYVGLFGCSYGLTIKNVILDSSCSITSMYIGSSGVYMGGIIGYCYASKGQCNIGNCVNMGSVTFSGSSSNTLYLGGIVGQLYSSSSSKYNTVVKNCANYGSIVKSGTTGSSSFMGGNVGYSSGLNSNYIQNCINYGTIIHSDETSRNAYVGGIAGFSYYTYIENCVSAGEIPIPRTLISGTSYIGSVVGYVGSDTYLNYCYYTSDVGLNNLYGYADSTPGTIDTPTSSTNIDSSLISDLNNQATNKGWNKWIMLHLNGGKINDVDQGMLVVIGKYFPDPVIGGNPFLFWCTDTSCAVKYDPKTTDISGISDLYAHWGAKRYTVTFNANGGDEFTPTSKNVVFNSTYGDLPTPSRTGYDFTGWFIDKTYKEKITSGTAVPIASNHTLYAHWSVNTYTVTYDVNGGNEFTPNTKEVTFDSTYGGLADPTRTEYDFTGWYKAKDGNDKIESSTKVTTAGDHTIYAHWSANTYTVTFDFDNGTEPEERTFAYNTNIIYPENPIKEGHLFFGWNNTITTMTAYNLIIKAKWVNATPPSNYISITFDTVNLSDNKIEEIIKEYTDNEFVITEISRDSEEGIKVIVKFNDVSEAINFVETISASSDKDKHNIKKVNFINGNPVSLSFILFPLPMLIMAFQ